MLLEYPKHNVPALPLPGVSIKDHFEHGTLYNHAPRRAYTHAVLHAFIEKYLHSYALHAADGVAPIATSAENIDG